MVAGDCEQLANALMGCCVLQLSFIHSGDVSGFDNTTTYKPQHTAPYW